MTSSMDRRWEEIAGLIDEIRRLRAGRRAADAAAQAALPRVPEPARPPETAPPSTGATVYPLALHRRRQG
ncbi:MAG TPA: hypothetical protein VHL98_18730 [Microvirga sp.]|jgi:hypothetical protein|nr:hypothetical protein [Microvirga sp.]